MIHPGSSTASSSTSPHPVTRPIRSSTLHELLMKRGENTLNNPVSNQDNISTTGGKPKVSRLSMSAPTQTMGHLDQIWAHREPRQHLLSTGSLVEAGSTSSLSTGGALSPDPLCIDPLSHDEGYEDSDDDSDHYDDYSTDNGIYVCHVTYRFNDLLYKINFIKFILFLLNIL